MSDEQRIALRYVGEGRYIAGVPARDLTADETKEYPGAAKSPLYARVLPQGEFLPPAETEERS